MTPQGVSVPTVLAVDDSPVIRRLVEVSLSPLNVTIMTAGDGASTCRMLTDERPDVLVLDVGLPDMTGWDVLDFARGEPALDGLPVIMLTGFGDASDRDRADEGKVSDFLVKPFRPNDLREAVRMCLHQTGDEYLGVPDTI